MTNDPIPTIRCRSSNGRTCRFFCRYCDAWHLHSIPTSEDPEREHRVAHCFVDNSPFLEPGYYLRLEPGNPDELKPSRQGRRRPIYPRDGSGRVLHGWEEEREVPIRRHSKLARERRAEAKEAAAA
jgi:hypothetical protein